MALRNKNWDRQLENGLPDSRLSGMDRERKIVIWARMPWEKVFCANCGADGGLVTADFSPHVFYLCDNCVAICGEPANTIRVDETAIRGL